VRGPEYPIDDDVHLHAHQPCDEQRDIVDALSGYRRSLVGIRGMLQHHAVHVTRFPRFASRAGNQKRSEYGRNVRLSGGMNAPLSMRAPLFIALANKERECRRRLSEHGYSLALPLLEVDDRGGMPNDLARVRVDALGE
jgi:hypothetical protein